MSDRLNELRRQRALLQEHLAWLDREIAAAEGRAARPGPPPAPANAAPAAGPLEAAQGLPARGSPAADPTQGAEKPSPVGDADADALIAQFGYDPKSSQAGVKRGCWIAFLGAFITIGLVILSWWLLRSPA